MTFLAVLSALFTLVVTILWLVIGWRAMRAHENIADNISVLSRQVGKIADSRGAESSEPASRRNAVDPSKLPRIREEEQRS